MIESIIEMFTPTRGFIATSLSFICGIIPSIDNATKNNVVFIFQITAFSVSIIVGLLTILNLYCKISDRSKAKSKNIINNDNDE